MKIAKRNSVTTELLLALIPYTRQNLQLTFQPSRFFDELDRTSNYSKHSIKQAYYRAKRNKLFDVIDEKITISKNAEQIVRPYTAQKLVGNVQLMVIFDIPESQAHIRREFRYLLRMLKFEQIQQSVWVTNMDHTSILRETVDELHAHDWIKIYESAPID